MTNNINPNIEDSIAKISFSLNNTIYKKNFEKLKLDDVVILNEKAELLNKLLDAKFKLERYSNR